MIGVAVVALPCTAKKVTTCPSNSKKADGSSALTGVPWLPAVKREISTSGSPSKSPGAEMSADLTTTEAGFMIGGFPSPLAGSEPMAAQFGAIKSADVSAPGDFDGDPEVLISRFTAGSHGTPVSADDPAAFFELLGQVVTFFAVQGNATTATPIVTNTAVIEE